MFKSAHKLLAVCMVAVFSMVAYGCSTNNNGAKTERDEALANLATATTERDMARAEVTSLMAQLETAMNDMDGDGVNDDVASLMAQLETAMNDMDGDGVNDDVASLMAQLETAMNDMDGDGVNDDVASLMAQLETAMNDMDGDGVNDDVASLMAQLETAMNDMDGDGVNDDVASLMAQLETAMNDMDGDGVNDDVASLMAQLETALNDMDGDGVNDDVASLMAQLTAALNDMDGDGVNDDVASLMAQLTAALNDMDGDGVNDDVASLMAQLTAAMNDADGDGKNDEVARLEGELTAAMNDADGDGKNDEVARLEGELTAAMNDADGDGKNDEVARLEGELTAAMNDADGDGKNDEVARLEGELTAAQNDADGDGKNDEVARLEGELTTAQNDADGDGKNDEVARLEGELATANATVTYTGTKGSYDTAQTASLVAIISYGKKDANVNVAKALVATAEAAQTAAVALQTAAEGGTVAQIVYAQNAVDVAGDAVTAARAELAQAETTESAMPYAAAIKGLGDTDSSDEVEELDAMAERTRNDVEVTVSYTNRTGDIEGSASDVGNGWYRGNVANEDDGKETVTVYTNIENTMDKFSDIHGGNASWLDVTNGVLTFTVTDIDDFVTYISGVGFPGPSDGSLMLTYDGTSDSPKKFDGTFNGAPGEYSCTSDTDCTATADSKGKLTALVGTWTFIPAYLGEDGESQAGDGDTAMETREDDLPEPNVAVPDTDYLRFGYWTKVDKDGKVAFQTFFGSAEAFTGAGDVAIADLVGSATYKGPAAGRYAVKTFNPNATLDSIRQGEFRATAELTANFGGDDIAVSQQDRISGKVDGFKGEHGDDLSTWKVNLKTIAIMDATFADGDVSGGGNVGGSPVTSGSWEGAFFGNPAENAMDDDAHPGSVAGEFDAHSSHGHVAGAFGATR